MTPYACPVCGNPVVIMAAACEVLIGDDGAAEVLESSPLEWPDQAPARCYASCGWRGYAIDAQKVSSSGHPEAQK